MQKAIFQVPDSSADQSSEAEQVASGPAQIDHILVIVDRELLHSQKPLESKLLARAVELAKTAGAELSLFHVCYDDALDQHLFTREPFVGTAKSDYVDGEATRLAELSAWLTAQNGIRTRHEARWDKPESEAILRRIHETGADLVLKQSSGYDYFVGLLTNTDWELIRNSPASVYFVGDESTIPKRIVTAIGSGTSDDNSIIGAADYQICATANLLTKRFEATNTIVHAYPVPQGLGSHALLAADPAALSPAAAAAQRDTEQSVNRDHQTAIRALADYFHVDPSAIRVQQGRLAEVAPTVAGELNADLIVMGARSLNRFERFIKPVSAEPVLANAPCDLVIVRDDTDLDVPASDERPLRGVPGFDPEQAILDPDAAFDSPTDLAGRRDISVRLRQRILDMWQHDLELEMTEEDEGGPVRRSPADTLDSITQARETLACTDEDQSEQS
jgi:nucleotide-binding universal stress UspA family protein